MLSEIVQAWLYIENTLYNGVLSIQHNETGLIYTIDNCNEQCMLNVFCSDENLINRQFIGCYTHIQSFLNEHKDKLLQHQETLHIVIRKKRQREET